MPLSKARNRERMRALRATYVQPKPLYPVQPSDMKSGLAAQGIGMDGNRIRLGKTIVQPINTPALDAARCLVQLDADGCPIPDYE